MKIREEVPQDGLTLQVWARQHLQLWTMRDLRALCWSQSISLHIFPGQAACHISCRTGGQHISWFHLKAGSLQHNPCCCRGSSSAGWNWPRSEVPASGIRNISFLWLRQLTWHLSWPSPRPQPLLLSHPIDCTGHAATGC